MDTVAYHPPAVMCAYQTVGAKQLLFGSDAPPLLPLLPRAKQIIEELPISEAEREDIFGQNALRLLQREMTRALPHLPMAGKVYKFGAQKGLEYAAIVRRSDRTDHCQSSIEKCGVLPLHAHEKFAILRWLP